MCSCKNTRELEFIEFLKELFKNLFDLEWWMELFGIDDPSGYVFEAVDSNRLNGVTVTAYTKDRWTDDFGETQEEVVVWDAEEYDQRNPLVSDIYGTYAWDVPEGQWSVKYEKDGYETAWSEWLPVPPPQTEINIGMVSYEAPAVSSVNADEDGVTVTFTKYMDPSTVSIDVVSAGSGVSGKVTPLNEEKNSLTGEVYASVYRFEAEEKLSENSVHVSVPASAESYAGTNMQSEYSSAAEVKVALTGFSVDREIQLKAGDTLTVPVQALPKKIGAGQTVETVSNSPSIISVANSVQTNEEGVAMLTVTGELPGKGVFTCKSPDSDVAVSFIVTVLKENQSVDTCANGHEYQNGLCIRCGEADPEYLCFAVDSTVPAGSSWYVAQYEQNGKMVRIIASGNTAAGQKYVVVGKTEEYEGLKLKCFFVDPETYEPVGEARAS